MTNEMINSWVLWIAAAITAWVGYVHKKINDRPTLESLDRVEETLNKRIDSLEDRYTRLNEYILSQIYTKEDGNKLEEKILDIYNLLIKSGLGAENKRK